MKKIALLLMCLITFFATVSANEDRINTLIELKKSKDILVDEIKKKSKLRRASKLDDEREGLKEEIRGLNSHLDYIETTFEKIATGIDTSGMNSTEAKEESLSDDLQLLIKPLVFGAKEATEGMRKKAKLQEDIEHYKTVLPQSAIAYENINKLLEQSNDSILKKDLTTLKKYWEQQILLHTSNLNATLYQLTMIDENEVSFSRSWEENSKKFFEERGRFLLEGLVAFIVVLVLFELIYLLFVKLFPSTIKTNRSFYVRFGGLLFKVLSVILAILAPMAIFFYEEDWVLFSIGLLVLFGIAWTFRYLMPKFWQQARLLLNIGSVREEERIYYQNLPWRVKNINIFTVLENPDSGVRLRLPIEELVGLASRPSTKYEPWFPCRLNDWVLLSNNYYGKVVGVSLEFIELVDIGGGHRVFIISEFLSLSPLNLSTDFRIVTTLGISYRHQKESTTEIVATLEKFINKKIKEEGYEEGLKKLLVEFSEAGDSSLNIDIIANFSGDMSPLYNRLKRAIGRWSVDACTENGWEIPFPQLTVHQV